MLELIDYNLLHQYFPQNKECYFLQKGFIAIFLRPWSVDQVDFSTANNPAVKTWCKMVLRNFFNIDRKMQQQSWRLRIFLKPPGSCIALLWRRRILKIFSCTFRRKSRLFEFYLYSGIVRQVLLCASIIGKFLCSISFLNYWCACLLSDYAYLHTLEFII